MNDERRHGWWLVLAVFACSLAVIGVAQLGSLESEMTHDSANYLELARSILRGDGFQTQTQWALNIPGEIPRADTYRAPLFPFLAAALSFVTPDLFSAAKWVSVLAGATIPMLVFLICRRRVGLSLPVSLLAAGVALVHHHLLISATRPLTETAYTAAIAAAIYLASGLGPRPLAAGLLAGLAWLLRYQALLLLPVALVTLAANTTRRDWLVRFAVFTAGFAVVTLPWMIRNVQVAGHPAYTELKYHMVSSYDPEGTTYHYFHGLEPAIEPLDYMRAHPAQTLDHLFRNLKRTAKSFPVENAGNVGFAIAALAGAFLSATRRRGHGLFWLGVGIYGAANVFLVAISFFDDRHLTSLDPFVVVLLGITLQWLWQARPARVIRPVALAALALGILWEARAAYRAIAPHRPQYFEYAEAVQGFLAPRLGPSDALMGEKPYYLSWLFDRPAVSLPWSSDEELLEVAREYGVRYACVGAENEAHFGSPYPGSFLETGDMPPWLQEVHVSVDPHVVVYEILEPPVTVGIDPGAAADEAPEPATVTP